MACAVVSDMDPHWLETVFRDIVRSARQHRLGAWSSQFVVADIIEVTDASDELINKLIFQEVFKDLPDDIHNKVSNKLVIAITDLQLRSVLISEFQSSEDLQNCLKCSTFLPIFSGGKVPLFRGKKYVDGGLSNQMPILNSDTIKISPFSGKFKDICPGDSSPLNITLAQENVYINRNNILRGFQALTALDDRLLSQYYKCGYNNAESSIIKMM